VSLPGTSLFFSPQESTYSTQATFLEDDFTQLGSAQPNQKHKS